MEKRITPEISSAIKQAVFDEARHLWNDNDNDFPSIQVNLLYLRILDNLLDKGFISKPQFLAANTVGTQKFSSMIGITQSPIFPDYDVPKRITTAIRSEIWRYFQNGVFSPARSLRSGSNLSEKDEILSLSSFDITDYGMEFFFTQNGRINVYDPEGYLQALSKSSLLGYKELIIYLTECLQVFRDNHPTSAIILLGMASEQLIDLFAVTFRDSLSAEIGSVWYNQKYKNKRDISERFEILMAKLISEYSSELKSAHLFECLDLVIKLTFNKIRLARNDAVHLGERKISSEDVVGYLYAFVEYFHYIDSIRRFLKTHPKRDNY
jgi:hypothetical protein